MDKSIGYYIEKFTGLVLSIIAGYLFFKYWDKTSFISEKDFFDKLITISTTLFGFLLTVLTLIVQSNSDTILKMKAHGSYGRLILFNRTVVVLSAVICLFSLFLIFIREKLSELGVHYLQLPSLVNFTLFAWTLIDTVIFVAIFYKILLSENNK